jgi:calcineurin-like phosphoesterase family protein
MSSNLFFSADFHIGHFNILTLGKGRPFSCLEEMHTTIADRYNAVVRPGDIIYYLGDFALKIKWQEALRFRQRLMGNIYFIKGNHDSVAKELFRNAPEAFVWMRSLDTIRPKIDGIPPITLCHYALRTFPGKHKNHWSLYGHSHGGLPEDHSLSFDVGVDCWNFTPVSIEQVAAKMRAKLPEWEAYKESLQGTGRVE